MKTADLQPFTWSGKVLACKDEAELLDQIRANVEAHFKAQLGDHVELVQDEIAKCVQSQMNAAMFDIAESHWLNCQEQNLAPRAKNRLGMVIKAQTEAIKAAILTFYLENPGHQIPESRIEAVISEVHNVFRKVNDVWLQVLFTTARENFITGYIVRRCDDMPAINRQFKQLANTKRRSREAAELDQKINAEVAKRIEKRGNRKQPSLTAIRKNVAKRFNVSDRKVLRAQRKKREAAAEKNQ